MPQKILFVCLGNICRSPAAEGIMNHLIQQSNLGDAIICDSAATSNYHTDAPPDRRMTAAALDQGIVLTSRSRQVKTQDFRDFELILAMDRQNYEDLKAMNPDPAAESKIRLICDYCTQHRDQDIPDPYFGGASGFHYVIELLQDACQGLLESLTEPQAPTSQSSLFNHADERT